MRQVELYDTTLRDGTQYEGISLSAEDKIAMRDDAEHAVRRHLAFG